MKGSPQRRSGTAVDTTIRIRFYFNKQPYMGYAGDTLASALLANGVKIIGRSFKLHRPRGLMAAGLEEPNGLLQLEQGSAFDEPNVRATQVPLYPDLRASGQNAWPSVKYDLLGALSFFQRLLPASFYYKSMIWPSWHFYEGWVRKLAGLGKAPTLPDAQCYQQRNLHCDLLVVGGGPAGLKAALAAAKDPGQQVVLAEDQSLWGGGLLDSIDNMEGLPGLDWVAQQIEQLNALPNVQLLLSTHVAGYFEHNFLVASQRLNNHTSALAERSVLRERLWRIRAKQVVLATGALERPLVFANNDRPGIMLASALRTYLHRYGVVAGKRTVVITNNCSAYQTALDLHDANVEVAAIIDTRQGPAGPLQEAIEARGIALYRGYSIKRVKGGRAVKAVQLAEHLGKGQLGNAGPTIACDLLAMSGGWTPTIHLYSQAGGKLRYDEDSVCLVPNGCEQNVSIVGAANSEFGFTTQQPTDAYWFTQGAPTDKQWLDFQYDVKVSDIELAHRENMVSIEHVKRYTTNGMSVDQGKTSNMNTLAVMAQLSNRSIPDVGTTKFRPPYQPVTLGAMVGDRRGEAYAPRQLLPAHHWHIEHGGQMADYGWMRPDCYLQACEDEAAAVRREVLAVRSGVGMFDGSPLGKIEVKGPDAAIFLQRIYANNAKSLKPGFARYGLMCSENGIVIDDGVFVRLAEDHYLCHSTSGGAARIFQWLEEWLQCEWPDLQVVVSNQTSQWANVTVSGPSARQLMELLDSDIDFSQQAFAHMQFRQGQVEGIPARVLRASFTGEMTYEISVPARYGLSLWGHIYALGQPLGITPYGIESLMVLRTEKGYLHIGVDTDGTTTPLDLGWATPLSKKAEDFIGARSIQRPHDQRDDRLHFVGLQAIDADEALPLGGHIITEAKAAAPVKSHGYCTSACYSPTLQRWIALGLLCRGRERMGESLFIFANGKTVAAKIVPATHFDAQGGQLNV